MKLFLLFAVALCGASCALAQQTRKPAAPSPGSHPQVLFSGPPPAAANPTPSQASDHVTDAERLAVTITAWNLDIHLAPGSQSPEAHTPEVPALEAHALVTLRNDGAVPLTTIPLQLSSTLDFDSIGLNGRAAAFTQATIASDADHTGQLREAAISLPAPLAPQATLALDVNYGGAVPLTAQRLTAIGAPQPTAEASDWDRISPGFTALRGFGNVVWYPVASIPVRLGDGAKLFNEIGRQKLNDQDATVTLHLTDEFFSEPPTAAILDGNFVPLAKPTAMPTATFPGVITASLPATRLGFEAPSLFLANLTETDGNGLRVFSSATDVPSARRYVAAAATANTFIQSWLGNIRLGNKPHPPLTILALPEPDDAPAEIGGLLVTPLSTDDPSHLAPQLIHPLACAAFHSPRAWLEEGVPAFLNTLSIEQDQGHVAAMENLNAGRPALALEEPATPGSGAGQDLLHAISPVYYRTKAAYVLWMLRSVAGDKPLQAALQAYDPAQDTSPAYFEHLLEKSSGQDLTWFFQNWVDRDPGLPDLAIGGVYPSPEGQQQVLVAVDIVNNGYAEADVPLTVKSDDASLTDWVRVPAHGTVTHRMTLRGNPVEVDLNDGSVPEVQDSIHQKLINEAPAP